MDTTIVKNIQRKLKQNEINLNKLKNVSVIWYRPLANIILVIGIIRKNVHLLKSNNDSW